MCVSLHAARTVLTVEWLALLEGIHTSHQIITTIPSLTQARTYTHTHKAMHTQYHFGSTQNFTRTPIVSYKISQLPPSFSHICKHADTHTHSNASVPQRTS